MWGFKRSKELVGVDIGSSSVKAVQLRRRRGRCELVNVGVADLAPDAVVEGSIMDALSVSGVIQKVFDENHITARNVATSVSGSSVVVKRITVAAAPEQDLAATIPSEAQRQLAFDPSELNISYQVLGPAQTPNALDVMLVAARREKVSNYTSVLSQVGKKPTVVDVDAFALENVFEAGYEPPPDQTCALLNLGASLTNVNIVRNGIPLLTRDIPVGGKQYTEALQKALDLSFDEAERVKLGQEMPQVSAEARKSALQAVSANLVAEIQKTFSFLRQMSGAETIDRIYLAGGTARIEGLAERVQEELEIPVEVLNPLRQIQVSAEEFDSQYIADLAPRLAVAVGLALRSFDTA